ncbi:hypothetical protein KQI77_05540 [Clostridium sp. MSJ-8]|uniref:hypothetical protein n=1 Tax=Clostridium sp. MSJ-8 TaxID=2841510 RepID=UPI001C0EB01D|nr:hypothetical protein [Clostridium sp. MSJ-8]MBU5487627.1 hypothetical protein [Clostridium sp. MSJ-8]
MYSFIVNLILVVSLFLPTNILTPLNSIPTISQSTIYDLSTSSSTEEDIDISSEIDAILSNKRYLLDEDKQLAQDISKRYNQTKIIFDNDKKELMRLKDIIIKEKLGDDYEEFIAITKKNNNSINEEEKQKLEIFRAKLKL